MPPLAPTRPGHGTAAAPAPTHRAPGPTRPGHAPAPTRGPARHPRHATATGPPGRPGPHRPGTEESGAGGRRPPRAPRTAAGHAAVAATGLARGHPGGHDAAGTTTTAAVAATEAGGPTIAHAHHALRDRTITTHCRHRHPTTWDRRRTATAAGHHHFGPTGVASTVGHRVDTPTTLATRITLRSTWCRQSSLMPEVDIIILLTITATA